MANTNKKIDPLPDEFSSEEEAGEFWDTHSITDYQEYLEPVKFKADIKRRHFQIEVDEESFKALRAYAKKQQRPAKQLVSELIKQKIAF
ncbi:MAG: CopG family antitoxin [bacterium]